MKSPVTVNSFSPASLRWWWLTRRCVPQDILGEAAKLPSHGWRPLSASRRMLHTDSYPWCSTQTAAFPTFSNLIQPNPVPTAQSWGSRRKVTITGYLPSFDKTNDNFLFESDTRAPRKNTRGTILSFPDHSMEESMCDMCHWWQWDLCKRIKGVSGYLFFSPLQGEKLKGRALVSTGGGLRLLC